MHSGRMFSRLKNFRGNNGYQRWQAWTDWPMVGLALLFLLVLILPLAEPIGRTTGQTLAATNIVIWAVFAADYLLLLYLSPQRSVYLRTHVLDLLVIALPFLRPLRLLRLVAIVASSTRRAGGRAVQRVTVFAVCVAVIVMATSAVVVFDAEKAAPRRNIKTLGDALWWAVSTVTTVGYGDLYPVTPVGRVMATVLMLTGVTLVGTITAAVAAWFVNIVRSAAAAGHAASIAAETDMAGHLSDLTETVDRLRGEIALLAQKVGMN